MSSVHRRQRDPAINSVKHLEANMRAFSIFLAIALIASAVVAQQPAAQTPDQVMKTYSSSSDVMALLAKAKSERKEGQPMVAEPILLLAPYRASLEYRPGIAPPALHEREAELMYVIDGSATMIVGGKLVNEKRTNADNLAGTGIEGGTSREVAKGDFIIVPENTAHWFSAINETLVLMTFHVPRTVNSPQH
jgi:mannose-6-phosphate isomerase-like protein (cupin superfamily)